jgi:nucleoside-diphosphate-sugar epimerase|tara:strand:+ start:503 stop:1423 length:921 start_codon:yes stop_codon:yes gene_type:complete
MKYLITGGLGYLGSEICLELIKDNSNRITVFDKGIYGISHFGGILNNNNINVVIGDIRDKRAIVDHIKSADVIIHLAGLVGAPLVKRKTLEAKETNLDGLKIVTDIVSKNQRFVFASTGSTYGKLSQVCNEKIKISPLSLYGVHKAEGEKIVSEKNATCLRYATVYGLSLKTRRDLYINNMIQKALIDRSVVLYEGSAKRSFAHINDIARATIYFSQEENYTPGPINIGDSRLSFSKREICNKISELTEFTVVENEFSKDADQRDYVVSYEKMENLGFKCEVDFNSSLKQILNYYQILYNAGYENG